MDAGEVFEVKSPPLDPKAPRYGRIVDGTTHARPREAYDHAVMVLPTSMRPIWVIPQNGGYQVFEELSKKDYDAFKNPAKPHEPKPDKIMQQDTLTGKWTEQP